MQRFVQYQEKEILLVGTAHISKASVEEVKKSIEDWQPDAIAVELCQNRYIAIENPQHWQELDLFSVFKQRKVGLLLASLILSGYQRKIGMQTQSLPGMEMKKAVEIAKEKNIPLSLIDRDIGITLRRTWLALSFWEKSKLFAQLLFASTGEKLSMNDLEKMLDSEQGLDSLIDEISVHFPGVRRVLLHERDLYMVQKIKDLPQKKILSVVGAAHITGMQQAFSRSDIDLAALSTVPKSYKWRIIALSLPLLVIASLAYGFLTNNQELSMAIIERWVYSHSILAAFGALLAGGHPLAILVAFCVSPFTSLQPIVKTGWVVGFAQMWLRKPKNKDLIGLSDQITSFKGFYANNLTRALLVSFFSGLGSTIGTVVSIPLLFSLFS